MLNEVLIRDARSGRWLRFRDPRQVLVARRPDEVAGVLRAVARAAARGQYTAGFVAYEAAPAFDAALAVRPDGAFPLAWFGIYRRPVEFRLPPPTVAPPALRWKDASSRRCYLAAIRRIKRYIKAGDTYQVNYTWRLTASGRVSPRSFFLALTAAQEAPYGAFLETRDFALCSASPELFFRLDGRRLVSRPMKGTAPRGLTQAEDVRRREWLRGSAKNRAENLMIVDMVRNDLGRVAEAGSVVTSELFAVEKYPTVWQMTSTVQAETRADLPELFGALFPPASITGAPKARTMEIIAELENTPRRIYTGSIGFWGPGRTGQFNVAIRTLLVHKRKGTSEYGVGGGIVWDSRAPAEFEEGRVKARILTRNMPEFSLLETLRWTPDGGYFLLEHHLSRLKDSADYFAFPLELDGVRKALNAAVAPADSARRVRLLVARSGAVSCEVRPLAPAAAEPVPVRLARSAVDSSDPFLYHKTTNRRVYEEAVAACPGYADVLLWNERDEMTESCIGNLVAELGGKLYTPPVRCGLLPGTFRRYLLEQGKIRERVIRKQELAACRKVFLVNSVRQWWEVRVTRRGASGSSRRGRG